MSLSNRQIVLNSRPEGEPVADNFRLQEVDAPKAKQGEMLLRTIYLSLDPYMRGRMSDAESYADPVAIDEVMVGGTVSQVVESHIEGFKAGDWVLSMNGWQDYAISNGEGVINLGSQPQNPSYALGVLGMPGFTAYMGLLDIGKPQAGETVVVAAASGAVGANVGQIAKLKGAKVIGIAGGAQKCSYVKDELGFDACIDHKADDFAEQLAKVCDSGIDVYYENVGGKVFDAVLPLLNTGARIPVCGLVSQYNATELPPGPDRLSLLMGKILTKRMTMKGFIIFDDYAHRYEEFATDMQKWVQEGKIKYKEHLIEGLENAPEGLNDVLAGRNFGKMVVKINNPE
ncbi:NADP-dependent oxidoreductase [Pseudoalteromonas ruthenica]|uniref:NADP-dependent oxidoreductase n=1 Tax=Pseudoalteromonas ruthenica TaxID=151081 RepID=A0A0F4PL02_9GAMM|nr:MULTISPECIES: NADP-dependent oxidoreductase [Pseudoalteromonas]KJY95864.1 NADP-dependent oxidoreductase [Pseudoalteromonas ruthenica]KJZ00248.1 NADP-dependent oxidoreductase [Pseudoalteromonas ruthenica]MCF2860920.1 NADP-dependent oxidoreductase [Pseudoalteromonas sp. CNAT2-18]MCG7556789.1 NADP-dependent oxidoreductase [Pseudoalteromonas sp. CNAT2-18.1]TLX50356.1 NADP-dependent oxidoreductase [Pseudoalteromonas ruthenica]|tara:strand:- start:1312 stop:2340 length:1029 start_codon:yes stop_codon:yes gene_type:complete